MSRRARPVAAPDHTTNTSSSSAGLAQGETVVVIAVLAVAAFVGFPMLGDGLEKNIAGSAQADHARSLNDTARNAGRGGGSSARGSGGGLVFGRSTAAVQIHSGGGGASTTNRGPNADLPRVFEPNSMAFSTAGSTCNPDYPFSSCYSDGGGNGSGASGSGGSGRSGNAGSAGNVNRSDYPFADNLNTTNETYDGPGAGLTPPQQNGPYLPLTTTSDFSRGGFDPSQAVLIGGVQPQVVEADHREDVVRQVVRQTGMSPREAAAVVDQSLRHDANGGVWIDLSSLDQNYANRVIEDQKNKRIDEALGGLEPARGCSGEQLLRGLADGDFGCLSGDSAMAVINAHSDYLDTAAQGGNPDGEISNKDLRAAIETGNLDDDLLIAILFVLNEEPDVFGECTGGGWGAAFCGATNTLKDTFSSTVDLTLGVVQTMTNAVWTVTTGGVDLSPTVFENNTATTPEFCGFSEGASAFCNFASGSEYSAIINQLLAHPEVLVEGMIDSAISCGNTINPWSGVQAEQRGAGAVDCTDWVPLAGAAAAGVASISGAGRAGVRSAIHSLTPSHMARHLDFDVPQTNANRWIRQFDSIDGIDTRDIARELLDSDVIRHTYGVDLSDEDFVAAMYRELYARAPDADGLAHWLDALDGGLSRQQLLTHLIDAPEFTSASRRIDVAAHNASLDAAYEAVFGRVADEQGLAFWRERLQSGESLENITEALWNSPEGFAHRRNLVQRAYGRILGRQADAEGLDFWATRFDNGMDPADIYNEILHSPEATQLRTRTVTEAYEEILGRAPDAGGLAHWTGELKSGTTARQLREQLTASPEAVSRRRQIARTDLEQLVATTNLQIDPEGFDRIVAARAEGRFVNLREAEDLAEGISLRSEGADLVSISAREGLATSATGRPLSGRFIFVVTEAGDLRLATGRSAHIHHSTLSDGGPVRSAGEIELRDGAVVALSNTSGHFVPTPESLRVVSELLEEQGFDTSHASIEGLAADGRLVVIQEGRNVPPQRSPIETEDLDDPFLDLPQGSDDAFGTDPADLDFD